MCSRASKPRRREGERVDPESMKIRDAEALPIVVVVVVEMNRNPLRC